MEDSLNLSCRPLPKKNGFQKKTQKTPQGEIEKAIKIKEAYYADKQSQKR